MASRTFRALGIALLAAVAVVAPGSAAGPQAQHTHPNRLGAGAAAPAAASVTPAKALRKVALGVSMDDSRNLQTAQDFAASVGRAPAVWSLWGDWGGPQNGFPDTALMDGLLAQGSTPMIFWEPIDSSDTNSPKYRYSRIASGAFDGYIRQWAKDAKAWGGPVILRFAHEFDGYWFPWGIGRFNNTAKTFVRAWRHVWNIFKGPHGVGAKNVKFLWSPLAPTVKHRNQFPGDKYVDYVGFSAFNWGSPKPWQSMKAKYRERATQLTKLSHKPIVVAETGTAPKGGSKAIWIRNGYPAVYKSFPRIKAIVYFNLDTRWNGQKDWRLTAASGALAEYAKLVAQPRFQGTLH